MNIANHCQARCPQKIAKLFTSVCTWASVYHNIELDTTQHPIRYYNVGHFSNYIGGLHALLAIIVVCISSTDVRMFHKANIQRVGYHTDSQSIRNYSPSLFIF